MTRARWHRSARRIVTLVLALAVALAFVLHAGPAAAQRRRLRSPYERAQRVPQLPAPFALPELAHPGIDLRLDGFLGGVVPERSARPNAMASLVRASAEANVFVPRRLFVGVLYPFASALPPDGGLAPDEQGRPAGRRALPGNVEAHVRAVFPLPTWLEIGFMLGVTAPTAAFDRNDRADRSAALAAASFDPTNVAHFLPGRIALRPAGDLRIVRGPIVLQGRHGIDVLVDAEGVDRVKAAGRLVAHVGWLVSGDLEVSVEASQLYFFASEDKVDASRSADAAFAEKYRVTDARRSSLSVGPGIRYATPLLDVGASLVTSVADPLSPASVGFIGARVSVIGHVSTRSRSR